MANANSVVGYHDATLPEMQETAGITQLGVNGDENAWFQVMNGLLIQGGRVDDVPANGSSTVDFHRAYPKKVLGVFLQLIGNSIVGVPYRDEVLVLSLAQFEVYNDYTDDSGYYWWAIGV